MDENKMCFICGQEKSDGVYVFDKYICTSCQYDIINTSPDDENYEYYRKCMKAIWEDHIKGKKSVNL